ncbi:sigma E protease regulator RseP [Solemya velesiana gill symbiont]|uniref:Zinc metalloprotease n=1 Tax=Solemya velesiana gill symbiont TaxID=1918948 RepID=A0A1T2KWF7_9GAMM|nr:sigma E protease regulator RseP [Solemya velesiana gill symbiont]OOZ37080.1 RIP metalloprotease RseP [Solemya velesiana gill symbiont]
MDSFLFTVASFIVALGVLITVHEFGHFWVARKLGVKVLRFSIGFGKALWSRTGARDDTEYVIAAIPLGGYVKMLDEREGEVAEEEKARAFNRQSLSVRTAIVAAGPVFNFFFAIFAFWAIFVAGDDGTRPLVGEVKAESIAYSAGFRADDELISIGGRSTPTWESAVFALLSRSDSASPLEVVVRSADGFEESRHLPGGELVSLSENGNLLQGMGLTPKRPVVPPVIGELVPGEAASVAGIRSGDRILSVDGEHVPDWGEFLTYVRAHPGQKVELEVERGLERLSISLVVGSREANGETIDRIGAGVHIPEELYRDYRVEVRYGPVEAVGEAVVKTWDMSLFMLKMLGRMVTGEASVKNLSGPISIAQTAGKSASYGLVYFLKFLALISISLGVLNLLPIPVLDGGHLLFFLVEGVKGSPMSEEAQIQSQKIGMLILLALMGLAFYVDIARLLG